MATPVLTRREMFGKSARLGTAGLVLGMTHRSVSLSWAGEESGAPTGFKIGACDWTLGKSADPTSFQIAKRIGLDGVQVDLGRGKKSLPLLDAEIQTQFLKESKHQDIEIASVAMGVLNNVPYKSDPRAEEWVAGSINVCKAFGVNVVLLAFFGAGDLRDDKEGVDLVVKRLQKVAPQAEKEGVVFGLETWLSANQLMDIIQRVGSPAVKVFYDLGNSHHVGLDIYKEIRFLGDNICQFHAKDYDGLFGKGSIDFESVRHAMDDIGYRGWILMEGIKMPLGVEESCRYDGKYLKGIFPRKV